MNLDPRKIERISPGYWRNSQLSIARFYDGCLLNGHRYILDHETDELVRQDIYTRDLRNRRKQKAAAARDHRRANEAEQQPLLIINGEQS